LEDFGALGFTTENSNFTGEGWDSSFGAGVRLGWLGKFVDEKLRLGVNYTSRTYMTKFDKYKNLFAEQGSFDIPENISAGIAYDFTPAWTATFDIQRIFWSDVKSIGNPGPNVFHNEPGQDFFVLCPGADKTSCLLGGDNGLGFGWHDQTVYKIGVDWAINKNWNARAGWNYAESPIQPDQILFNFVAPATPEHHLTLGVGYEINETFVVDGSFVYAFSNPIDGPTPFGPGGATVTGTNASIDMVQLSIGATLGWRF
jgi:long-chain fatty acid transport protein